MSQAADRIRQFVEREPRKRLTTLLHHVTVEALRWAFFELKKDAAAGADGMTWGMYEKGLEGRLADLHDRVYAGAYRATPSRRVNIPKPDGGTRPLGVAAIEDKLVQKAVAKIILTPIYEVEFLGFSYGFPPGRGRARCARRPGLRDRAAQGQMDRRCRPPSVFDTIPHAELMQSVARRIVDRNVLRLIKVWLKTPVEETDGDGKRRMTGGRGSTRGTP